MGELARESARKPPPLVGLCPGEHLGDFYMPLDRGDSFICPMCDRVMVVYMSVIDPRDSTEPWEEEQAQRLALELGDANA